MTTKALALLALLCLALSPALADEALIDDMEGDVTPWGTVAAETTLVKQGKQSLRWEIKDAGSAIGATRVPGDWSHFRSLKLWVHSAKMTGARIAVELLSPGEWKHVALAPDEQRIASVTFKIDWRGWNSMEIPMWAFSPRGKLGSVGGLRFRVESVNLPGTVLCIDDIRLSTEDMQMSFGPTRVVLDCQWRSPFQNEDLWKRRPGGDDTEGGIRRYWCWLEFWYKERPDKRDVLSFEREFDADISGWDELFVRLCQDRRGFTSVSAVIDGQTVKLVEYAKGTGKFGSFTVPVAGKRLTKVIIDISEPPDQVDGNPGQEVTAFFQMVGLQRKEGGGPPAAMTLPAPGPEPEPIETAGLPAGLYFGRDDIPWLRAKAAKGVGKVMAENIVAQADRYVAKPIEITPCEYLGGGWFSAGMDVGGSRDSLKRMMPCAFAYVLTGDRRYADEAKRAALALCAIDHWTDGPFSRYPLGWGGFGNPFAESDCARALAPTYDWIYNTLSDSERKLIEQSLEEKAQFWLDDNVKYHFPANMNQGSVFGSGYLLSVLALHRTDRGKDPMVRMAREKMEETIGLYFGKDGWAPEGFGYWGFTMGTAITGLAAMDSDMPEGAREGIAYPFYMQGAVSERFGAINFNDCHYGGRPSPSVLLFYAYHLCDRRAQWLWEELYGRDNPGGDIFCFLWYDPDLKAEKPRLLPTKYFRDNGATFLRSGWQPGDTLLALQTSQRPQGHRHRDSNSFILEAFGERLLCDPGQISYADPTHQELKKAWLHNTITFDDKDQEILRSKPAAVVPRCCGTPTIDYVRSDATGAYPSMESVVRHVLFLRPASFVVIDEAKAKEPMSASFNMMFLKKPSVSGNTVQLTLPKTTMLCQFLRPAGLQAQHSEWPTDSGTGYHVKMAAPERKAEHRFVTLLCPSPAGGPEAKAEEIAGENCIAAAITRGDSRDVVLWRTGEGAAKAGDVETDGQMGIARIPGYVAALAVVEGTFATARDAAIRADAPGVYAVEFRDDGVIIVGASSEKGATVTVQLPDAVKRKAIGAAMLLVEGTGLWQPLEFQEGGPPQSVSLKLPPPTYPEGMVLAVIDGPPTMTPFDNDPPRVFAVKADGRDLPLSRSISLGTVLPKEIRLRIEDENRIDLGKRRVTCDGKALTDALRVLRASEDQRDMELALCLPPDAQPPPTDDLPVRRRIVLSLPDTALYRNTLVQEFVATSTLVLPKDAIYLSDIEPVALFSHGGVKRNTSYLGEPMAIAGAPFAKGILIHPETKDKTAFAEAIYDLTKHPKAKRFKAFIGLEDHAAGGSITFAVEVKREGKWQRVFETGTVDRTTPLQKVEVDLTGAEQLRLHVGDAGNGIGSDHAAWGGARLE